MICAATDACWLLLGRVEWAFAVACGHTGLILDVPNGVVFDAAMHAKAAAAAMGTTARSRKHGDAHRGVAVKTRFSPPGRCSG